MDTDDTGWLDRRRWVSTRRKPRVPNEVLELPLWLRPAVSCHHTLCVARSDETTASGRRSHPITKLHHCRHPQTEPPGASRPASLPRSRSPLLRFPIQKPIARAGGQDAAVHVPATRPRALSLSQDGRLPLRAALGPSPAWRRPSSPHCLAYLGLARGLALDCRRPRLAVLWGFLKWRRGRGRTRTVPIWHVPRPGPPGWATASFDLPPRLAFCVGSSPPSPTSAPIRCNPRPSWPRPSPFFRGFWHPRTMRCGSGVCGEHGGKKGTWTS